MNDLNPAAVAAATPDPAHTAEDRRIATLFWNDFDRKERSFDVTVREMREVMGRSTLVVVKEGGAYYLRTEFDATRCLVTAIHRAQQIVRESDAEVAASAPPRAGLRHCLLTTLDGKDSAHVFLSDATIAAFGIGRFDVTELTSVTHIKPTRSSVIGSNSMMEFALRIIRDVSGANPAIESEVGALLSGALVAEQKVKDLEQALAQRDDRISGLATEIVALKDSLGRSKAQVQAQSEKISTLLSDLAAERRKTAGGTVEVSLMQLASVVAGRPVGGCTPEMVEAAATAIGSEWSYQRPENTLHLRGGISLKLIQSPQDDVVMRYAFANNSLDAYRLPPPA